MDKEFIPYEQALALKELGFDEHCFGYYNNKGELTFSTNNNTICKDWVWVGNQCLPIKMILAPTFSQAFRWFREKYELTSEVCIEQYRRKTNKKWMFSITYLNEDAMYEHSKTTFENYEEAELECLKKLIKIVSK